jgi:hypothetical protein
MNAPREGLSPDLAVQNAVRHLKDAEVDLLVAVRTGKHPHIAFLVAALALLQEALVMLARTVTDDKSSRKTKKARKSSTPGARFV